MLYKALAVCISTSVLAFAHCDSLDGPVVEAARRALSTGNVNLVLPWVPADQESAIREAFGRTAAVRTANAEARKLADLWFFETVVRIHRTGEGATYSGLKSEASHADPVIAAADKAISAATTRLSKTRSQNVSVPG